MALGTPVVDPRSRDNLYEPWLSRVREIKWEIPARGTTRLVATLALERRGLEWKPGQFLQVSAFGAGEVPISISSPPGLADTLILTVRAAGVISSQLARARVGDQVGLRGPCGNGFDIEAPRGRDVLFVAGGIGLAPLRSLIWEMVLRRNEFGRIIVLHGARTPSDLLYTWQYAEWQARGVEVLLTVDHGDGTWETGEDPPRAVGFPPALFPRLGLDPARTWAYLCGPAIMIQVACRDLVNRFGVPARRCVSTLERHMKCGVGKCGHCLVVDRYLCMDGPVFSYDQLQALERIEPPW